MVPIPYRDARRSRPGRARAFGTLAGALLAGCTSGSAGGGAPDAASDGRPAPPPAVDARRPDAVGPEPRPADARTADQPARDDAAPLDAGPFDAGVFDLGRFDAAGTDAAPSLPTGIGRSENMRCADPGLDSADGVYYLVCTARNTRYYTSVDLRTWVGHDMTIDFPPWVDASPGVWAHELERIDGRWYLYFAAPDRNNPTATGLHRSIGVVEAAALEPGVRFTAPATVADTPLATRTGSTLIDPFVFRDADGQLYLYYNQYNAAKSDSGLYVNRLSDPVTKVCCQTALLGAALARTPRRHGGRWTEYTLEAPAVFTGRGYYYLLFSGNDFGGTRYAIGLARSRSPLGPFEEAPSDPQVDCARMVDLLGGHCLMGPGGASVSPDGALVFHARMDPDPGRWAYFGVLRDGPDGWPVIE